MDLIRDILTKVEERAETHMSDLMPDPENAKERASCHRRLIDGKPLTGTILKSDGTVMNS